MGSWETSTGLLEEFTLEVKEAWFGKNQKFGENLLLNLQGPALVDGDVVDPEHTVLFTCGQSWKAAGGGASAVSTSGADQFNSSSKVGKLIDGIVKLGDDVIDIMKGRGESFEAESWINLSIDFVRTKTGSFTPEGQDTPRDVFDYIPTGLRELGEEAAPAKSSAKASSNSGGGKAAAIKLRTAVKKFAKDFDDNDEFVAAVLDGDLFDQAEAVEADEELLDAIIDGSVYAEAH